ncbi:hypothetical protein BHE18_01735 [Rossellomorea aquimaris]|uniref:Uncharacterized protein n=1 Tax=Rossellomorea aquimaris TaxID=189382 RepID=A0A1J6VWJ3_9BACI|nr:hypothetical protein BHE18_01735 [Rossellomorea aquimaris]
MSLNLLKHKSVFLVFYLWGIEKGLQLVFLNNGLFFLLNIKILIFLQIVPEWEVEQQIIKEMNQFHQQKTGPRIRHHD